MKTQFKKNLLLMAFLCCIKLLSAQGILEIYDMQYENDYYLEDTNVANFNLSATFKISKPEKTLKLFIQFGNSMDSTVLINREYEIFLKDGKYGFWESKYFITVWNKRVNILYDVTKNDLKKINSLIVYAQDLDNKFTEKKNIKCNYQYHFKK